MRYKIQENVWVHMGLGTKIFASTYCVIILGSKLNGCVNKNEKMSSDCNKMLSTKTSLRRISYAALHPLPISIALCQYVIQIDKKKRITRKKKKYREIWNGTDEKRWAYACRTGTGTKYTSHTPIYTFLIYIYMTWNDSFLIRDCCFAYIHFFLL